MITLIRTAATAPGKALEVKAFAEQIAKVVSDKTGVRVKVCVPVGGDLWRIAWIATFDTMAQWESLSIAKLMADADYRKAAESSGQYLLPSSLHDEFWVSD